MTSRSEGKEGIKKLNVGVFLDKYLRSRCHALLETEMSKIIDDNKLKFKVHGKCSNKHTFREQNEESNFLENPNF